MRNQEMMFLPCPFGFGVYILVNEEKINQLIKKKNSQINSNASDKSSNQIISNAQICLKKEKKSTSCKNRYSSTASKVQS